MITPKTHPQFYTELRVFDHVYDRPLWIWNQLTDDTRDAIQAAYKKAKPEELKDGLVDNDKFVAWWTTEELRDADFYNRALLSAICIPRDGAPPLEGDVYDMLTSGEINGIRNFTRPLSIGSASALTAAPAKETSEAKSSASIPSA